MRPVNLNGVWGEISGALGDLGTLLPLMVGMVSTVGLDLGTTLICTGLSSILCGYIFGIPMPIQPMKTIVALAIANALTLEQALVAGFFVGAVTLVGGLTRLIDFLALLIPLPVIRGVQLQVGCKLALKGVSMALKHAGSQGSVEWRPWGGGGGLVASCCCLCLLLVTTMPLPASRQQQHHASSSSMLRPAPERDSGTADRRGEGTEEVGRVEAGAKEERPHAFKAGIHGGLQTGEGEEEALAGGRAEAPEGGTTKKSGRGQGTNGMAEQSRCDVEAGGRRDESVHSQHREGLERFPLLAKGTEVESLGGGECAAGHAQQRERHSGGLTNQPESCKGRLARGSSTQKGEIGMGAARSSISGVGCGWGPQSNLDCVVPSCLLVVILGVGLTVASNPSVVHSLKFGPSMPQLLRPTAHDAWVGVVHGGFSQLPLTLLNSVLGLSQLASATFPSKDTTRWSPRAVAMSVGLINVFAWLGSMPVCHGSGGLAAQASIPSLHVQFWVSMCVCHGSRGLAAQASSEGLPEGVS